MKNYRLLKNIPLSMSDFEMNKFWHVQSLTKSTKDIKLVDDEKLQKNCPKSRVILIYKGYIAATEVVSTMLSKKENLQTYA